VDKKRVLGIHGLGHCVVLQGNLQPEWVVAR